MFANTPSSVEAIDELKCFKPPYCPNKFCSFHQLTRSKEATFIKFGARKIKRFPYVSFRFRCQHCLHVFSNSFFSFSYRDRIKDTYKEIDELRWKGSSKREIAKSLGCSLDTVLRRIKKISRQSLLRLAHDTNNLKITESIAYDGIENFTFSQYDPNNLNHAVGRESCFLYDFNFCHLNRKGKMSPRQEKRKLRLEEAFGKYPVRAIESCSKRIFERLLSKSGELTLHTDNHFLYRSAIKHINKHKITHLITPSKVTRNYRNRLFAINHMDMMTRHHLCDFKRETIAFAKTSIAMLESFLMFAVHKSYRRTKFTKKQKQDERAHTHSPAMYLGLTEKVLSFNELFSFRLTKFQVELNEDWKLIFESKDPFSRRPIRAYGGI